MKATLPSLSPESPNGLFALISGDGGVADHLSATRRRSHAKLFHQCLRGFDEFRGGEAVVFVKMFRDVGGLAEFAGDAEGLDAVGDAGVAEGVGNLRRQFHSQALVHLHFIHRASFAVASVGR